MHWNNKFLLLLHHPGDSLRGSPGIKAHQNLTISLADPHKDIGGVKFVGLVIVYVVKVNLHSMIFDQTMNLRLCYLLKKTCFYL